MDVLHFLEIINLGLIMSLFAAMVPAEMGDSTSIFEIELGVQPIICTSLTIPKTQSIEDPNIIHPPANKERVNSEYTITTPNFPSTYPTNIQCTVLIKAPSFDYHVVLEVRRMFDVEPSKGCVRDFLEVTDGPYGFSKKIGRFCNSDEPPKEIKSSGPFVWLRFRSDDSLSHKGFEIAYRFIRNTRVEPKMHYCYKKTMILAEDSFNLNTSFILNELQKSVQIQGNTSIPIECVFDFHVKAGFNMFVFKADFKQPTFPVPCASNSFDVFYKGTYQDDLLTAGKLNYFKVCEEKDLNQHLFKRSTRTTVRVAVQDLSKMNTFSFIMTSVMIVEDSCSLNYFMCSKSNKLCIARKLLCNGEVNCPDKTDENCIGARLLEPGEENNVTTTIDPIIDKKAKAKEEEEKQLQKTNIRHAIILGSIAAVLVISMLFCLILTIHSKKKEKDSRRINVVDVPADKPQTKNLFYELLQSSEPSVAALSTEKLSSKVYIDNQIWSKRPQDQTYNSNSHRNFDFGHKLNGGIKSEFAVRTSTFNDNKAKADDTKGSSMIKIGKYLSVPNPAKSDTNSKPIIPNKSTNQVQSFSLASPSEDFQSWSSHSFSKPNSSINRSTHNIQRASSMGSVLRKRLQEPVIGDDLSKNIEWYCGPVVRGSDNRNNSTEILDAYSAKCSQHVPGCRSLPNFSHIGSQNPVYYAKPIPCNSRQVVTDSLDCSADDSSSYRDDTPSFSFQNNNQKENSHKFNKLNKNNGGPVFQYGVQYFCSHNSANGNDFVEYIA